MATTASVIYLVDPITGFAGEYRISEGTVQLLTPEAFKGQVLPADVFISRNSDLQVLECEASEFEYKSARLGDKLVALDFFLMLFDAEVQGSTKTMAAAELEKLFLHSEIRDHVLNIVYAAPLPPSASHEFVTQDKSSLTCLVDAKQFVASQNHIRNLFVIWARVASDPLVLEAGHKQLTALLISCSFFRDMVLHFNQAELELRITKTISSAYDPQIIRQVIRAYAEENAAEFIEPYRTELEILAASQMGLQLRQKVAPEDVAQNTITRAVSNWDAYRRPVNNRELLWAWLKTFLIHELRENYRRYSVHSRDMTREIALVSDLGRSCAGIDAYAQGNVDAPRDLLLRRERLEKLHSALKVLPVDEQQAVIARYINQMKISEVAALLQMTEKMASDRIFRGLKKLQEVTGDDGFGRESPS